MPLLADAPLVIATDGRVIANVTHVYRGDGPQALLDAALATGRQVFLGIALDEREVEDAKQRLDDAAAEIAAMVVKP